MIKPVEIPLDMFTKDELFDMMLEAHNRDVTFNQHLTEAIAVSLEQIAQSAGELRSANVVPLSAARAIK